MRQPDKKTIATIIACRLKSTRLPKKALLKIGDLASIELCLKHALQFKNVGYTVLATSDLPADAELARHTYSPEVLFHAGDPDDVIDRYLGVIDRLKIETVVRVTGDMPYVSDDILQVLLTAHVEAGADYTAAKKAALGTNLEIISAAALRRTKQYFPRAEYSEYMSFYLRNNPSHFKLNYVGLPAELIRDYRLTLDYPEDLEMFRAIEAYFKAAGIDFSLKALFAYLDANPAVAELNRSCVVKYTADPELVKKLNEVTTIRTEGQ